MDRYEKDPHTQFRVALDNTKEEVKGKDDVQQGSKEWRNSSGFNQHCVQKRINFAKKQLTFKHIEYDMECPCNGENTAMIMSENIKNTR